MEKLTTALFQFDFNQHVKYMVASHKIITPLTWSVPKQRVFLIRKQCVTLYCKISAWQFWAPRCICVFAYLCISVFAYVRLCETNVLSGGSHVLHTSLHYAQSPPSSPRTYTDSWLHNSVWISTCSCTCICTSISYLVNSMPALAPKLENSVVFHVCALATCNGLIFAVKDQEPIFTIHLHSYWLQNNAN